MGRTQVWISCPRPLPLRFPLPRSFVAPNPETLLKGIGTGSGAGAGGTSGNATGPSDPKPDLRGVARDRCRGCVRGHGRAKTPFGRRSKGIGWNGGGIGTAGTRRNHYLRALTGFPRLQVIESFREVMSPAFRLEGFGGEGRARRGDLQPRDRDVLKGLEKADRVPGPVDVLRPQEELGADGEQTFQPVGRIGPGLQRVQRLQRGRIILAEGVEEEPRLLHDGVETRVTGRGPLQRVAEWAAETPELLQTQEDFPNPPGSRPGRARPSAVRSPSLPPRRREATPPGVVGAAVEMNREIRLQPRLVVGGQERELPGHDVEEGDRAVALVPEPDRERLAVR